MGERILSPGAILVVGGIGVPGLRDLVHDAFDAEREAMVALFREGLTDGGEVVIHLGLDLSRSPDLVAPPELGRPIEKIRPELANQGRSWVAMNERHNRLAARTAGRGRRV